MKKTESTKYALAPFYRGLERLNLSATDRQIQQFLVYYELLVEWNQKMNLTAITEFQDVIVKHFLDSLSIVKVLDLHQIGRMIDVGTGAGFPGIPIKIMFPELSCTLLDSLNKRITFLNAVCNELGLNEIEAVHGRAEEFARNKAFREEYDLCLSRAVANLSTLSEYCLPFVRVGGSFISYKSGKIQEEFEAAQNAIRMLGGTADTPLSFRLDETDQSRSFVVIRKTKQTGGKYPRKAGLPGKEPLK